MEREDDMSKEERDSLREDALEYLRRFRGEEIYKRYSDIFRKRGMDVSSVICLFRMLEKGGSELIEDEDGWKIQFITSEYSNGRQIIKFKFVNLEDFLKILI